MAIGEPAFLCVAETARTLGLSELTIYRRVWDGSLPALRLKQDGAIRIPVSPLDEIARQSESPERRAPAPSRQSRRRRTAGTTWSPRHEPLGRPAGHR
jgi:helix-turn-helix protein